MTRIISIVNQKGGVGKTTTAVSLSSCLAQARSRTFLLDLDPQGNATSGLGLSKKELSRTVFDLLSEETPLDSILVSSPVEGLWLAPSNNDLLSMEWELAGDEQGKFALKRALARFFWECPAETRPDFVIIDCPPSLGLLSLNAILASDSIVIPVQCEYYALEGLTEILSSASMIRQSYNPRLSLEGILLTMADRRLNLSRQVEEDIRRAYKEYVFLTVISRGVRLSEAPSHGLPITLYDPESPGAKAYQDLTQEVMNHETKSARPWPVRPSL
ncbi:MAG: ParA family protein [bacterium]